MGLLRKTQLEAAVHQFSFKYHKQAFSLYKNWESQPNNFMIK